MLIENLSFHSTFLIDSSYNNKYCIYNYRKKNNKIIKQNKIKIFHSLALKMFCVGIAMASGIGFGAKNVV